jgi:tetratricopeptide (TPR) repeat protein
MNTGTTTRRAHDLKTAIEHHLAGRLDDAQGLYQQLHAADPRDSEVLYLMGMLCCDLGLFEPACRFLEECLAIAGNFPDALNQLAEARTSLAEQLFAAQRYDEAERCLQAGLRAVPEHASSLRGLGRIALQRGDYAGAEIHLRAALARRRDDADALNWLGLAQLRLEAYSSAETSLREALQLQPDHNQARNNLGLSLFQQGELNGSLRVFEAALAQDPNYANARINLANTLRVLGQFARARSELEALLAQQPESAEALNNLGAVAQDQGDSPRALDCLTRALALAPDQPSIRWNLALSQLQTGQFAAGWRNFESRWEGCESLRGAYGLPKHKEWKGEVPWGKHLLLWAEQGFGDTLQFIRFAQDVARLGATVTVQVPAELARLVRGARGVHAVVLPHQDLPAYDFHCSLMSLPLRLGLSLNAADLHGDAPYLFAAPEKVARWQARLAKHAGFKVGLTWAGGLQSDSPTLAAIDRRRSVKLGEFAPLLAVPGCEFFSLQKGPAAGQLRGASTPIHDFSAEWVDFADTAAFIEALDLVITVDTANVHLAGALGAPTWLLNRYDSCWRWLLGRDDTPWYSSVRQFRQPKFGAWQAAIAAAAAALAEYASRRPALQAAHR